jgi:hypothetical protein
MTIASDSKSAIYTQTGLAFGATIGVRFLYKVSGMGGNEMTSESIALTDPNIIYYIVGQCGATADEVAPVMGTAAVIGDPSYDSAVLALTATDNVTNPVTRFVANDLDNDIADRLLMTDEEGNATINGLSPSTTYNLTIYAQDDAGNISTNSTRVSFTTDNRAIFIVNTICSATGYTSGYGDIIFESDGQLTDINSSGLTVNGVVKYKKTFIPKQWYAVGFPFAPESYWGDFEENPDLYIWNGTYGDFWVKDYSGEAFNDSQTMEAGIGYIVQFPDDFEDVEVIFTSDEGVILKNITENDLDAVLALSESNRYYLVANPSVSNLTLSATDKYYIYDGSDSFELLTSGTTTVKPFESFVVANGVAQNSLKASLNIDNVTALEQLHWNDPVVGTEYYNLQGQKVQCPIKNSLYIVKKIHASGKADTIKTVNR